MLIGKQANEENDMNISFPQPAVAESPLTDGQLRAAAVPTTDTRGSTAATITTDTTAVTGTFAAITVLSDAVFTSLTRANTTGSLGSTTIPAGVTIFGAITGYRLASGAVIAYGA